jgi:type VI secretion system protein ImpG
MFHRHYQSELAFLREMGKELAHRSPGLFDHLALAGSDPDVERLLEGFALLAAQIRERVDDSVPELADPLAEIAAPHIVRPTPAATIVEMIPRPAMLRERTRIAAGTPLGTRPVDGARCTFTTSWDIDVVPLSIERATLDDQRSDLPEITLSMRGPDGARASVYAPGPIALYLHGSHALASTLLLWLAKHLDRVAVRSGGRETVLPTRAVTVPSLEAARWLWPWPALSPDGVREIAETFALPQKHFFVEVSGLDTVPLEAQTDELQLVLRFRRPPPLAERLPPDAFRLHCVPAVNVFPADAEPIARSALRRDAPLRTAGLPPLAAEVFSVERVTGLRADRGGRVEYAPFTAFEHGARTARARATFSLRRTRSPLDGGIDAHLRVDDPAVAWLGEETLSIEMTCTNRRLPASLRPGDVAVPIAGSPNLVGFRNISPVSAPVSAPIGQALQWQLLGELALNHRELAEVETLRAVLRLYNVPPESDVAASRANELRIAAISAVASRPSLRATRSGVVRGVAVEVTLDEPQLAGMGEAFVLGCALARLLAAELPLHAFVELAVRLAPSQRLLSWEPRSGTGAIL